MTIPDSATSYFTFKVPLTGTLFHSAKSSIPLGLLGNANIRVELQFNKWENAVAAVNANTTGIKV